MDIHPLGSMPITLKILESVARRTCRVAISDATLHRIAELRKHVDARLDDDAPNTYGVNTGFGALAEVRIAGDRLAQLQLNLIRSHATGVGRPYDEPTTRAMMLLRANVLVLGTSGVRPEVPTLLVAMLNAGIHPVIPRKGSVGASGDLAPLAHLALVLIGEGEAMLDGELISGGDALAKHGLKPVVLQAKEGLALINGTQAMTADAALAVQRARRLCTVADISGAMSLEALMGTDLPFDARIHDARGQLGQCIAAANLRTLTGDTEMHRSHADCGKVQDPYSLRCMPQVHGATRDVVEYAAGVIERECNAATDNPLVFKVGETIEILSGGNFHGQPIAFAADFLTICVAELGNIAERRIEQLVNPALSSGLPPFLSPESGLNSGFMIAQVTAAALVSENKCLAHPASVDSIPSSANREDHVSMGTIAARKAQAAADNVEHVLAIELLCGAQGIDLRRPLKSSAAVEAAWACIREHIPPLSEDRILHHDISTATRLVREGTVQAAVEAAVGPLA